MSGSQIQLFKDFKSEDIQSYIDKIQEIKNADYGEFNAFEDTAYLDYTNALEGVSDSQAALLLSTQGVTTAQIQQTLATRKLSTEEQYQAMQEAGLLARKKKLSNVELQSAITSATNSQAKANETMKVMGLTVATKGEDAQTVKLTASKLKLAVTTGILTKEEAELIAMTTGVTIAQKTQIGSVMPKWIANMKAMALATWDQVKATAAWLITTPAGWATMIIGGITLVTAALINHSKAAERAKEKISEMQKDYSDSVSELENIENKLADINQQIDELESKGKLSFTDKEDLENLRQQSIELERQLDIQQKIAQQKANEVVYEISKSKGKLDKDFDNSLFNYSDTKQYLEEQKETGLNLLLSGDITQENYNETISQTEKTLNDYYGTLLTNIEKYESNKQSILDKYNGDISKMSLPDKELYDSIVEKLNNAYKEIYSKSDYNKFVIEPIFNEEGLDGLQQKIIDYFINGGTMDVQALERKFGTSLIEALRVSCENAGIEFNELLENLYNQGNDVSYGFAPMYSAPNGFYEAQQNYISQSKIKFYNSLDDETKNLIINAEIPDNIKNGTLEEFKKWINQLNGEANVETDISLGIPETIEQLNKQLKPAMDSLKSAWQDIFTDDGFSLDNIDLLSTVDSIKSELDELNEIDGITVDYSSFEDFVRILENTNSTEEDVKQGFNELVQSIINAGVSGAEDFNVLKDVLEDLGVMNNELVAFESLITNTEALKEAGLDLANADDEVIRSFTEEIVSAENLEQAIAMLTYQKELCGFQDMNTSVEVANLKALAENAGYTGDVIKNLTELEQIYQDIASGTLTPKQLDDKLARVEELKELINASVSNINYNPDFDGNKSTKKTSSSSSSDPWKEAFEKEKAELDHLREMELITDIDYFNQLSALNQKYFAGDLKKYLDEYRKYTEEVYKGLKDAYLDMLEDMKNELDEVSNAVVGFYDSEIDNINLSIDELEQKNKILEKKKTKYEQILKAIDKVYSDEIDKINKVIEEIEKENDTLQEQLDRWDSILNAVNRVYDDELDGLNDKNNALNEELDSYNSVISAMETAYDEEINSLQKVLDEMSDANDERERAIALQKAQYNLAKAQNQNTNLVLKNGRFVYEADDSAIKYAKEELNNAEYDAATAELQKQIDILEEYKEKWSSVSSEYDKYLNKMNATKMFGEDYKSLLINGDISVEDFLNNYMGAKKEITSNDELISYYEELQKRLDGITDRYTEKTENNLAENLFGSNWKELVLQGTIDLELIASSYENAQAKMEDNQSLIDSYNEKISYYEDLKAQWADIADVYTNTQNAMLAAIEFGNNWEAELLDGRMDNFVEFKDNYVAVEAEINDNQSLIDSYNEKIEYYENLKAQWEALTNKYTEEKNKRILEQFFGNNYEATLLDTSSSKWEEFQITYTKVQSGIDLASQTATDNISSNTETIIQNCRDAIDAINALKIASASSSTTTAPSRDKDVSPAHANGVLGSANNHTALVGELGAELRVRDGKAELIGVNGAEFVDVKKDDIIFNPTQTNELLKQGSINDRGVLIGKSYNEGTLQRLQEAAKNVELSKLMNVYVPDFSQMIDINIPDFSNFDVRTSNDSTPVNINFGDIVLQGVQDPDGFAKAIKTRMPSIVTQMLGRD